MLFRESIQSSKLCRMWSSSAELSGAVTRSLVRLFKSRPAIGWIRANTPNLEDEIKLLKLAALYEPLKRAGVRELFTRPYDDVPWRDLLADTERLDIFFAYGRTWRNGHTDALEHLARLPTGRLRVILPDPDSPDIMAELARRFRCTLEDVKKRVEESAAHFLSLRKIEGAHANIEVRYCVAAPQFTCYLFDNASVWCAYSHRHGRTGVITLLLDGGTAYDYIAEEFASIFQAARPVSEDDAGVPQQLMASEAPAG